MIFYEFSFYSATTFGNFETRGRNILRSSKNDLSSGWVENPLFCVWLQLAHTNVTAVFAVLHDRGFWFSMRWTSTYLTWVARLHLLVLSILVRSTPCSCRRYSLSPLYRRVTAKPAAILLKKIWHPSLVGVLPGRLLSQPPFAQNGRLHDASRALSSICHIHQALFASILNKQLL